MSAKLGVLLRLAVTAVLLGGLFAAGKSGPAEAHASGGGSGGPRPDTTLSYEGAPLRRVLADVETQTGIRFLYRDALAAGIRISLRAETGALLSALQAVLAEHGLALRVDRERGQAILTRAVEPDQQRLTVLTGQVVDGATGAGLPHATLTWTEAGRRRGRAADADGTFRLRLDDALAARSSLTLTVSYVGYAKETVRFAPQDPPPGLTIRLSPVQTQAPEVLVRSYALQSSLDTTWQSLIRPERAAALGEASVLRALQPLPAVGFTPALVEGLSVRGCRSDGFRVLLDGIPIYNQHHLFGLFDAFNAGALQAVGLYYGVAPVDYQAPPGGTLAFRTRAGAQTGARISTEASPAAVSGTVEGPLADGQGSWLVSARHSILGLGWFGNESLVEQGLGIERATSSLQGRGRELEDVLFEPEVPTARFFDVHAKGHWETEAGGRWALAGYAGGDVAEQCGQRLRRDASPSFRERLRRDFVDTTAVETGNRWGNLGTSLQWNRAVDDRGFSSVTAAVSRYYSRFSTDYFLYVRPGDGSGPQFSYDAFSNDNVLTEATLTHRLGIMPPHPGEWTVGYGASLYDVVYEETAAFRNPFRGTQTSLQADLFGQYDRSVGSLALQAGLRTHYYSEGEYLRFSPRLQVHLWPDKPVTLGAGYTRNHQFLHRLSLDGNVSSAVWVPSTDAQPPGAVDHLMASLTAHPTSTTTVQVDGYWKHHENLRRHSSLARLRPSMTVLFQPWTVENTARARGLEVLGQQELGVLSLTGAYALSKVTVEPAGNGDARPADWDRRHQVSSRVEWAASPRASVYATWSFATGPPNPYAVLPGEPSRLDASHHLDLGATVNGTAGPVRWTVRGTLFNAYDHSNPWHRTAIGVLRSDGNDPNRRPDLDYALVDVYDLGVRPSLSLSATW
jgi:hypothetical protein